MRRRSLRGAALGAAIALSLTVTGCASAPTSSIAIGEDTVVIDVRTAAEYAGGHLETAINIDLQSEGFDSATSELDAGVDYVVYCRSGKRSAQAAATMKAAGLDVRDAGGITDAERSTGLPIVG